MIERLRRRNRAAAVIAVLLIALSIYAAFVKRLPFGSSFTVRAVFSTANGLNIGSPVRIAGLPVGSVTGIHAGSRHTSVVTIALDRHDGVHADSTLAIEPRLLFEGNFYVRLDPGSPTAPLLRSGQTIPLERTTTPVQIDQLLDVLDSPTRSSLKRGFSALSTGLGSDRPGSSPLREAARELASALPPTAEVVAALGGSTPGDLGHAVASSNQVAGQLAEDPPALSDLITASNRVLAALGTGQGALARDIESLDRLSRVAPAALTALDRALPAVTDFAGRLGPALTAAPPTLSELNGLFGQLDGLAAPGELPRLTSGLQALTAAAPTLERRLGSMLPLLRAVSACVSRNIVPAMNVIVRDGANTSGYQAWKDLLHLTAALSGASASFDGNGVALRIGVAEGDQSAAGLIPGFGQLSGRYQGEGVRPTWLGYGVVPPFRPDQPCARQPLPEVNR